MNNEPPPLGPGNGRETLLTLGPDLFGLIWNWMLLGALMVQIYYYYLSFKRDPIWLKAFVYVVFILDLLQTGLTTASSYFTFSTYWGNPTIFDRPLKTIIAIPLFAGFIAMCIQIFYAWRIWTLGRAVTNKMAVLSLVIVIVMLAVLQGIGAMIGSFEFLIFDLDFAAEPGNSAEVVLTSYKIWLFGSFICDTIIAFTMVYLLTTAKTASFFKKTNDIISRLIVITIASGAATAVCTLIDLVLFYTETSTGLIETPGLIVGKLFTNSLMVNLNSRRASESQSALNTLNQTMSQSSDSENNIGTGLRFANSDSANAGSKLRSELGDTDAYTESTETRMARTDRGAGRDVADFDLVSKPGLYRVEHPPQIDSI